MNIPAKTIRTAVDNLTPFLAEYGLSAGLWLVDYNDCTYVVASSDQIVAYQQVVRPEACVGEGVLVGGVLVPATVPANIRRLFEIIVSTQGIKIERSERMVKIAKLYATAKPLREASSTSMYCKIRRGTLTFECDDVTDDRLEVSVTIPTQEWILPVNPLSMASNQSTISLCESEGFHFAKAEASYTVAALFARRCI